MGSEIADSGCLTLVSDRKVAETVEEYGLQEEADPKMKKLLVVCVFISRQFRVAMFVLPAEACIRRS